MSITNLCAYIPSEKTTAIFSLAARHDKFAETLKYRLSYLLPYIDMSPEEFNALPNRATIEKQIDSYNESEAYYLQVSAATETLDEHIRGVEIEKKLLRSALQYAQATAPSYIPEKSLDERKDLHNKQLVKWADHINPSEARREPDRPSLANYNPNRAHMAFVFQELRLFFKKNGLRFDAEKAKQPEKTIFAAKTPACALLCQLCPNI